MNSKWLYLQFMSVPQFATNRVFQVLQVTIESMHIEPQSQCNFDYLTIGWDVGYHTFCGRLANGSTCSIVAEPGPVGVYFVSDGSFTEAGFSLSYTVVEPDTQSTCLGTGSEFLHIDEGDAFRSPKPTTAPALPCSTNVTLPEGTIESPGFSQGNDYGDNMNCQWRIPTPTNMVNQIGICNIDSYTNNLEVFNSLRYSAAATDIERWQRIEYFWFRY